MARSRSRPLRTLAVDIGGSGIKAIILDEDGTAATDRQRMETPQPATPTAVIKVVERLARGQGSFDRVSVGFPGVVREGVVVTAPNLAPSWSGINLIARLSQRLKTPVRAANDADIQGYGAIEGRGVELVITLGTGFGSALFVNGRLVPNLELAHHPLRGKKTYEDRLGNTALEKVGKKRWNRRLSEAIVTLQRLFNYDRLYIGGGNGKHVTLRLGPKVRIVPNVAGLLGGIACWRFEEGAGAPPGVPST